MKTEYNNTSLRTHFPPAERWEALRKEFMAKVDAIDKETPWSETEPAWWLQMMEARRCASGLGPRQ